MSACTSPRDRLLMLLLQRIALRNRALRSLNLSDVFDDQLRVRDVGEALEKGGAIRRFALDADIKQTLEAYLVPRGVPHGSPDPPIYRERTMGWTYDTGRLFPRSPAMPTEPMSAAQMYHCHRSSCRITDHGSQREEDRYAPVPHHCTGIGYPPGRPCDHPSIPAPFGHPAHGTQGQSTRGCVCLPGASPGGDHRRSVLAHRSPNPARPPGVPLEWSSGGVRVMTFAFFFSRVEH